VYHAGAESVRGSLLLQQKSAADSWQIYAVAGAVFSSPDSRPRISFSFRKKYRYVARYLLSLFVSLTSKVCALPTVSRASATVN
jgi:hypothetical protein